MQRRASSSGTPSSIARFVNSRTAGSAPRSSCSSAKRLPRVAIACTRGRRSGKSCANERKNAHSSSQTRIALQKKRVASGSPGSLRNSVRGMPSPCAQSTSSTRLLQLLLGGRVARTRTVAARAALLRASLPCSASRRFRNAASSTARPRRGSVRGCHSSTASASRRPLLPSTETIAAVVDIGPACTLAENDRKIALLHHKTQNNDSGVCDGRAVGCHRDRRRPQRAGCRTRAGPARAARDRAGEEPLRGRHGGYAADLPGLSQRGRRQRAVPDRPGGAGLPAVRTPWRGVHRFARDGDQPCRPRAQADHVLPFAAPAAVAPAAPPRARRARGLREIREVRRLPRERDGPLQSRLHAAQPRRAAARGPGRGAPRAVAPRLHRVRDGRDRPLLPRTRASTTPSARCWPSPRSSRPTRGRTRRAPRCAWCTPSRRAATAG
jgi:hypothetical protein